MRLFRLVSVIGFTAACLATDVSAHVFAIRGDARIGAYRVKTDGSLGGAINAFSQPSSLSRQFGGSACMAGWRQHGLTIQFYNLGGDDACAPASGRFLRATMRGNHWTTTLGLRIGDPVGKLRRLYPSARLRPGQRRVRPTGYWLVTRYSPIGVGGAYPGLLAEVAQGRVRSFQVSYAAGGD
jgi:hypothetical protein